MVTAAILVAVTVLEEHVIKQLVSVKMVAWIVTLVHDALDCVTIAWMGNVIDMEGARPGVWMETLGDTVMNHAANVWVESATKKVFVCRVVRLENTEETAMYLVRKIV